MLYLSLQKNCCSYKNTVVHKNTMLCVWYLERNLYPHKQLVHNSVVDIILSLWNISWTTYFYIIYTSTSESSPRLCSKQNIWSFISLPCKYSTQNTLLWFRCELGQHHFDCELQYSFRRHESFSFFFPVHYIYHIITEIQNVDTIRRLTLASISHRLSHTATGLLYLLHSKLVFLYLWSVLSCSHLQYYYQRLIGSIRRNRNLHLSIQVCVILFTFNHTFS